MTKNDAEKLQKGQVVYYLGLNYIVHECKVEEVTTMDTGEVEVEFDDGCVEVFNDTDHNYMYLTHKEALEAAEYELEGMLEMINEQKKNLTN